MSVPMTYQRTPQGVSAQVYQVLRGPQIFYLRVAEEIDENLETDAELHQRLHDAGVKVARVVHVEPFDPDIGRSVMITTEVPGICLADVSAPTLAAWCGPSGVGPRRMVWPGSAPGREGSLPSALVCLVDQRRQAGGSKLGRVADRVVDTMLLWPTSRCSTLSTGCARP